VEGPTLSGFTYHLIEDHHCSPRRSLSLFREWLLSEAQSFRENTLKDVEGHRLTLTS